MSSEEVLTPMCPACGGAPDPRFYATWPAQGWCGSLDCRLLTWAPMRSRAANLANQSTVDLAPPDDPA